MTQTPGMHEDPPSANASHGAIRTDVWTRRIERYVRSIRMWHQLYRATSYVKSALWVAPLLALVLVMVLAPIIRALDALLDMRAGLAFSGAQALYQTVITLALSFLVFTFGSMLVAIQVASGQLTPRIIATTLLRDNVVRSSVGLFVFTLIFAVIALNRLEQKVLEIVTLTVGMLGIACMATFLFLIDYAARLLRPVSILAHIGNEGLDVIETVYPSAASDKDESDPLMVNIGAPRRIVHHLGNSEIVLAVDLQTLVAEAKRYGGVIEFIPQVGDFVAYEEPLFALHGSATAIDDRSLIAAVAFGIERTLEQDPMFALRIMVDIALKALSPAINDPTTAVLAIDQIHRFLRAVGKRQLRGEVIRDTAGEVRVIYRTPNWEDFVHVACTEIRHCGANNVQIARRLRAMLDNVGVTLARHRHAALIEERERLDHMIENLYSIPEDLALARRPDIQGLGGHRGARLPET
jgi:uncharacterized membrane protein